MFYIGVAGVVNLIASIIFIGSGILLLQDNETPKFSNLFIAILFFVIAVVVAVIGVVCLITIKKI